MAKVSLEKIRHAYVRDPVEPKDYALQSTHLSLRDGGAYALLGPSGCGKTTLLNIISGLVRPTEGRVAFDGVDVTDRPTERRGIAQVFQFPVVYDAMTVRENLAFPLRNQGQRGAAMMQRVNRVLELTGLAPLAGRRARGLAAVDKQKLSLARGLVREDVAAILLDEPLTQVDPQMRWSMRAMLKQMQADTGRTMIYVTHDQTEALTFAEQVVVMSGGAVVQVGTPEELFERPQHTFVGYFIGSPGMNLLAALPDGDGVRVGGRRLALSGVKAPPGAPLEVGVRPEHVRLGREGWPVSVLSIEDRGRTRVARLLLDGAEIFAVLPEEAEIAADPHVMFAPERTHVFADSWRIDTGGARA